MKTLEYHDLNKMRLIEQRRRHFRRHSAAAAAAAIASAAGASESLFSRNEIAWSMTRFQIDTVKSRRIKHRLSVRQERVKMNDNAISFDCCSSP